LIDFSKKYDGSELSELFVTQEEVETAEQLVDSELKLAIQQAKENITKFHASQTAEIEKIETTKGIICWRENRAVNRQQKVYIL
jgi:histidinol dehydrogenase